MEDVSAAMTVISFAISLADLRKVLNTLQRVSAVLPRASLHGKSGLVAVHNSMTSPGEGIAHKTDAEREPW